MTMKANLDRADSRSFAKSPMQKKALGQFMLRDREIARRIAEAIPPVPLVVEIGPGDGALTVEMLASGHRVVGIEIDPQMCLKLNKRFNHRRDFRLVSGNILNVDWQQFATEVSEIGVTGNLPYHLSSSILFSVFQQVRQNTPQLIRYMVVMVQREVGMRLTAEPGTKDYGSLTLLTRYHSKAEYLFTVPANRFYPTPKVDGAVVRLTFLSPDNMPSVDYEAFRRVVRGCFAQRRKMMRNAIGVINGLSDTWRDLDYDFTRRPEQFTFKEFIKLTEDLLPDLTGGHPS